MARVEKASEHSLDETGSVECAQGALRRTFASTPASVAAARRYVAVAIGDVPRAISEAVALAVSELATNSVRHAGTAFTVAVERNLDGLRIEVADSGAGVPIVRSPAPSVSSGRGLRVVSAIADEWGVNETTDGPGKSVWFAIGLATRDDRLQDADAG